VKKLCHLSCNSVISCCSVSFLFVEFRSEQRIAAV
jgi:hypothetical protein